MSIINEEDDVARLGALLGGHALTQVATTAVRVGLLDRLFAGPATERELADHTGLPAGRLRRLLHALRECGLVRQTESGVVEVTAFAGPLHPETGVLHGYALLIGTAYYDAWSGLESVLRTGRPALDRDVWERLGDDPVAGRAFARTMGWNTDRVVAELLDGYAFPDTGIVADVGAGDGTLVATLLERYPALTAVAQEQPSMAAHLRDALHARGLADRCTTFAESFFDAVPEGADLYVLKTVLHNWDDDRALEILASCRAAMAPHARLLVIERPFDEEDLSGSAVRDLTMLVLFGAEDRSTADLHRLLERAGLTVTSTVRTPTGLCLVEARV